MAVKRYVTGGLTAVVGAAALMAGWLGAAPAANAGCQDNPLLFFATAQKCDGPLQPDGSWQRCVIYYYEPPKSPPSQQDCHQMGPLGRQYPFHSFYQPETHIGP